MNLAKRFMNRFRGLMRAHGTYAAESRKDSKGKIGGKAKTIKMDVTERLWNLHLMGKEGLGIVPIDDDGSTNFGAIDVDVYDLNLEHLEAKVRSMNLPLTVCRTKSGGAHLYLFFTERAPASFVRGKLMEWAVILGYPQVEVFPKQTELVGEDDVGSWINMPYFDGGKTLRYAVVGGRSLTPDEFLDHADAVATDVRSIESLKIEQDEDFVDAPPCLQHLIQSGFPEGTRNLGLFNLGVLCKMKFGDRWKEKLQEYNRRFMIPPLKKKEAETIVRSIGRKAYFYRCKEPPISSVCNRAICGKREFGIGRSGDDPGVTMDGMTKILTDPPIWMMNVNGRRVKIDQTEDFLLQNRFTKVCVEWLNTIPNKVSEAAWREIMRDLLEKVEEIEAPADAGTKGEFFSLLEKYCSERVMAKFQDELLIGRPWQEGDWIMFRSMDMIEWMKKKKFSIGSREAWNFLRDRKGRTREFFLKGKHVRVWMIPAFPVQTEPLTVPEISVEKDEF